MDRVFLRVLVPVLFVCASCGQPDAAGRASPKSDRLRPSSAPRPRLRRTQTRLESCFSATASLRATDWTRTSRCPSLIQKRLQDAGYPYEVVNAGVSGDTSAGGLSRLDWSLDGDVKILVIELGANDGLRGLPVTELKRNLTRGHHACTGEGHQGGPDRHGSAAEFRAAYTSEFRAVYRDLAREHDITFVPFYLDGVAGIPSLNIADGIHPNAEGSRIVEKTIWSALEPLLVKRTAGGKNPGR